MMDFEAFLDLPAAEIARLTRAYGPKVCVFPINGTRRWFMLEYPELAQESFIESYLSISGKRHVELYKLFFDHGIDTLVTPIFGPDLLERSDEYMNLLEQGLVWFAQSQDFWDFYADYDVRVQVYGDTQRYFQGTPYAHALEDYDELTQRTVSHQRYRLFFGVCAHDAAEAVARFGARFHREHGRPPHRREIVEFYYGEYVAPVDFFIGFDRPSAFDMPLIATGSEDLYFMVSPSPYLDALTLRAILYDHLYSRRVDDADYETLAPEDWQTMADFYARNRRHVLGLGRKHRSNSFWYPLPQVELSPSMSEIVDRENR